MVYSGGERRCFSRIDWGEAVQVRREYARDFIEGRARNLSQGGICVRLNEELELRSLVDIRLKSDLPQGPIEFKGRVNWTMARADLRKRPPYQYDIGVEFTEVTQDAQDWLSKLVASHRQGASDIH